MAAIETVTGWSMVVSVTATVGVGMVARVTVTVSVEHGSKYDCDCGWNIVARVIMTVRGTC